MGRDQCGCSKGLSNEKDSGRGRPRERQTSRDGPCCGLDDLHEGAPRTNHISHYPRHLNSTSLIRVDRSALAMSALTGKFTGRP